jgi:hypothetical protein
LRALGSGDHNVDAFCKARPVERHVGDISKRIYGVSRMGKGEVLHQSGFRGSVFLDNAKRMCNEWTD